MKYRSIDKSVDREDFIFNGKTTFHRLMENPWEIRARFVELGFLS